MRTTEQILANREKTLHPSLEDVIDNEKFFLEDLCKLEMNL